MANLLYLVHRLPYPPNKGDKVRSYHLLRHLLQRHRVFLGTFIDDPDDEQHLPTLKALCPDLHVERIVPRTAKLKSLAGLLTGEALTLAYYRSAGMQQWVQAMANQHNLQASVVFSSAMAQYAQPLAPQVPMLVDFVDVDSAKWTQYAPAHRWPLSMLYRREGQRLLAYEREVAAQARRSYFVTPNETALFVSQAPECRDKVQSLSNGVDADFFASDPQRPSPFAPDEQAVVFTGAMDYWPNIDGVSWFVAEMLPRLRAHWPRARFYIVGRSPTAQVQALAGEHVVVTGTVPDVRPYLQHAAAVVAPLRVARGIQNKILEAMAMQQAVITVNSCADAIGATPEQGLLRAETPDGFVQALQPLLDIPGHAAEVGLRARAYVERGFSWQAHLSGIDACLAELPSVLAVSSPEPSLHV
ncbi:TIGR03087 family PEP-CTERM/XrtA system glycosyltransferase [Hydrogenophaga sp. PBL-H3]|uniref:TIGR03087 family PEP-CTERM/XrtA system glycosyltransferase n=1 Tax=Hydrogenophaga sp. PBL-H3 TaxID=434010 RepID=UPI00131FDCB3|nr:TIGR03087 family PEP-CTERM/XrtA system glycosyltransferase [Hydrogenophaga sp. PBL-H3]QHE76724.1 TIGR03087 family PEP-CTERM/XrtA system glycosyltransferase [Hydrogenophaga sp. PBL-H3]QHE81148.1 TIGR03087 family PEP-CTERM/XrtA system glycosyltransferase [Hydrogenophaga sp. PBL-H3]